MNLRLIAVPMFGLAAMLAACDNNHDGTASTGPVITDYSGFVQALITQRTCETNTPSDLANLDFLFDPQQDTATPTDISDLNPACSV